MDLTDYKNSDGTYTSPKNGKIYKSEKALRAHLSFKKTEKFHNFAKLNDTKVKCQYCSKEVGYSNLSNHEKGCYLNPDNLRSCQVCDSPIKNFKKSKGTCSRGCANKLFRSGEDNGNWKGERYQSICFLHHEKKCVVCGENKIVAVHHYDHNHENNDPANLVPLCPTHHNYVHSRYVKEVQPIIDDYVKKFILSFA